MFFLLCFYYSGTTTYICDFHREQAWERWLKKGDNDLNHKKKDILKMLRAIARSDTVDAFKSNLLLLERSDVWLSHQKRRKWFQGTWLEEAKARFFLYKNGVAQLQDSASLGHF